MLLPFLLRSAEQLWPYLQKRASYQTSAFAIVETLIDLRNLADPALPLGVLQRQYVLVRPVKVICNIRYLLIEPI